MIFTVGALLVGALIIYGLAYRRGQSVMLNSFKGRNNPKPQLGAYYPDCDILVLNPKELRKYTINYYLYVALHEYYHMFMHRDSFEIEKNRQQFEMDAEIWANTVVRILFPTAEMSERVQNLHPKPETPK